MAEASGGRTHRQQEDLPPAGFEVEPSCGRERSGSPLAKLRRLHGVRAVRRNVELVEASRANAREPGLWRKRVGVEPTGNRKTCRPPVLKTGTITGPHALPQRCDYHVSRTPHWLHRSEKRWASRTLLARGKLIREACGSHTKTAKGAAPSVVVAPRTQDAKGGPTTFRCEPTRGSYFWQVSLTMVKPVTVM